VNPVPGEEEERPDMEAEADPEPRLGWKATAIAAVFYAIAVGAATWPRALGFRTSLPSLLDPLQHLWIMRWYRACLLEGQSWVLCPEIQYPTGVPLGCFSPLHFQAMLFVPLSLAIPNDILCYNLVWLFGMVFTGLGTFLLAWRVVGDRWCAGFGGLLAMLSAPMLWHAAAHLELIFLGAFPLFLWTWLRLVDRPGRGRLAASAAAYLLLALCAAYYAVYAIFPAALYAAWTALGALRRGDRAWLLGRLRWLSGFAALVVPGLVMVFGNQLWAKAGGYTLPRSFAEFRAFSAPLWSYAAPCWRHALGGEPGASWYAGAGLLPKIGECCSYLGVVALGLLACAAAGQIRSRERSMLYWWACLALIVVLSGGTAWTVAGHEVRLPAYWLKKHFPPFEAIRVPSRFNLFAAVIAAVLAASGLRRVLARLPRPWMRGAALAALAVGAVADLGMVPYFGTEVPPAPGCYAFMAKTAPGAAFLEAPQFGSEGSDLYSLCGYWQSSHRGRTNAGYCGQGNALFDNLLTYNSPFSAERLARPDYLADPDRTPAELGGDVPFRDVAWLYLKTHDFRFVVLHRRPEMLDPSVRLDRLESAMEVAKVYEDGVSVVYDRERRPAPDRPVLLTTRGWRIARGRSPSPLRVADREARLSVYSPGPHHRLRLALDAESLHRRRQVRLMSGGRELARWDVRPGSSQDLPCPTFRLPAGLHELVLASDSASRPRDPREAAQASDMAPYSLRVDRLELEAPPLLAGRPDITP
jgi:hypothetical protein